MKNKKPETCDEFLARQERESEIAQWLLIIIFSVLLLAAPVSCAIAKIIGK